ncbi:hypothetical protein [Sorangium cellulosum]|uniref:hypothetical protein n=1 Tax=Sorangium cellulosum TaxID=56 RepID=UPI000AC88066|nr:hypothetical protein [Sorangium cellulosum]
METAESVVALTESIEEIANANCDGNACSSIALKTTFWPYTTTIKTVTVKNKGSRGARVSFDWGNVLGGCGVSNEVTVSAGESVDIQISKDAMVVGYCKMRATFL